MDSTLLIQLIILVLLIILSAFFSSSETALTCVSLIRIRSLADEGNKKAARTLRILENPSKMLSTILIGNNIVNIAATSLTTAMTIRIWGNYAVGIASGILTLLLLLFGEIVPKTTAKLYPEKLALLYSFWILKLMFILTPVIFIINKLSSLFLTLAGLDPNKTASAMTETELKTYVDVSHEEGVIEADEHEMILNVFDLNDSLARDIMIPRIDMTMINVDAPYRTLQALFKETMYSRIPVFENDTDNIIGVVMLKDFFLITKKSDFSIRSIMRDAYYTYETKKTDDLLNEMRENSYSVAIVIDEYGATVGLITLEDLLEEIVGEIRDEYDDEERELIKEKEPNCYEIEGSMKIDDVNDFLGTTFDSEDYDSIAGLMIEQLDRLPFLNETVALKDGSLLQAAKIEKNRVTLVILTLPGKEDDDTSSNIENKNILTDITKENMQTNSSESTDHISSDSGSNLSSTPTDISALNTSDQSTFGSDEHQNTSGSDEV